MKIFLLLANGEDPEGACDKVRRAAAEVDPEIWFQDYQDAVRAASARTAATNTQHCVYILKPICRFTPEVKVENLE